MDEGVGCVVEGFGVWWVGESTSIGVRDQSRVLGYNDHGRKESNRIVMYYFSTDVLLQVIQ